MKKEEKNDAPHCNFFFFFECIYTECGALKPKNFMGCMYDGIISIDKDDDE